MKIATVAVLLVVAIGFSTSALAQVIEMAGNCEQIRAQLAELVKKPDTTDAKKIKDALGLDILDSCDDAEGRMVCYQCVDKNQNLRTLQLLQERDSKKFALLGFGCRCREK